MAFYPRMEKLIKIIYILLKFPLRICSYVKVDIIYNEGENSDRISGIDDNQWLHLVLLVKGPIAYYNYLYVNGGSTVHTFSPFDITNAQNKDGNLRINEEGKPVAAYVDELYFWNRALSDDEVKTFYCWFATELSYWSIPSATVYFVGIGGREPLVCEFQQCVNFMRYVI